MKKYNAVGANIFAGGFTVGVAQHFNVLAHLEHDDYGVEVAKRNFPKLPVFIGPDDWPEKANKPVHFLYSNPPCAIWSLAGNRDGRIDWRTDPRLQRIRDIFTLVERYRPYVWCWESVCQAFEKGRSFVEELAAAAAKLGYSASYVLVDATYLRAPMTRKRFFLVLHRVDIDWAKATPDFAAKPLLPRDVLKGVKPDQFRSRISDTPIGKQLKRLIADTPPGGRISGTFERWVAKGRVKAEKNELGKIRGKPSLLSYRIDPDKPVGVLFGDKSFHHTEVRHLALNELGVLHGFPKDYDWVGEHHRLDVQRGVLPPVGAWLAKTVAAAIASNRAVKKPARTLVDFRRAPGAIRAVDALPADVDLNWKPPRATAREDTDRPRRRASAARGEAGPRVGTQTTATKRKALKNQQLTLKGVPPAPGTVKKPNKIRDLVDVRATSRAILAALAKGVRPATSGELLRARILEAKLDDDAMAAEVRKLWPGRTTGRSDVAWNRAILRKGGVL